jgi:hypothetical protein
MGNSLYIAVDIVVTGEKKYLTNDCMLTAHLEDCQQFKTKQDCQMFIDKHEGLKRRVMPLQVNYLITHLKT